MATVLQHLGTLLGSSEPENGQDKGSSGSEWSRCVVGSSDHRAPVLNSSSALNDVNKVMHKASTDVEDIWDTNLGPDDSVLDLYLHEASPTQMLDPTFRSELFKYVANATRPLSAYWKLERLAGTTLRRPCFPYCRLSVQTMTYQTKWPSYWALMS